MIILLNENIMHEVKQPAMENLLAELCECTRGEKLSNGHEWDILAASRE